MFPCSFSFVEIRMSLGDRVQEKHRWNNGRRSAQHISNDTHTPYDCYMLSVATILVQIFTEFCVRLHDSRYCHVGKEATAGKQGIVTMTLCSKVEGRLSASFSLFY